MHTGAGLIVPEIQDDAQVYSSELNVGNYNHTVIETVIGGSTLLHFDYLIFVFTKERLLIMISG